MSSRVRWLGLGLVLLTSCRVYWVRNVYCDGKEYLCEDPARPYCDLEAGRCLEAPPPDLGEPADAATFDMSTADGPEIAPDGGEEVVPDAGCTSPLDCPADAPLCAAGGACEPCSGAADDTRCKDRSTAAPRCQTTGPNAGRCGQCRPDTQAMDCPTTTPVCGTNGTCRGCTSHSECASGVCLLDGASAGQCAPENMVTYVDKAGNCSTGNGTKNNPTCEITLAFNFGRPYVHVVGSATAYAPFAIDSGTHVIVGPGKSATPTAKVTGTTSYAVNVTATATPTTAVLDGLELIGAGGGSPSSGVHCLYNGAATSLTVRNAYVHGSGGYGIDTTNCKVTLEANIIGPTNAGGGLSLNGGSVDASNNLIVGNGLGGPGVNLQGGLTGTFWFNTVAGNSAGTTSPSAFYCLTSTAFNVQASIVWANNKDAGGSSIIGTKCNFSYSDLDETTTPTGVGNFKMDPMLNTGTLPATGYRLPANSPCVDKVTTTIGGTLPNHDVDGHARPRASTGGYDCGGSQAP